MEDITAPRILSDEERQFLKQQDQRILVTSEFWGKKEYSDSAWHFFNTIKERTGIGRHVDIPKIKGGVGDELEVSIKGVNLAEYLPAGMKFRGYRYDPSVDTYTPPPFTSHQSSPFYSLSTDEVALIVDGNPKEETKQKQSDLRYSGLIILHEIGHGEDARRRPGALDEVFTLGLLQKTLSDLKNGDFQTGNFFGEAHFNYRSHGFNLTDEEVKTLLSEFVTRVTEREFAKSGFDLFKRRLDVRNIPYEQITQQAERELSQFLWDTYTAARSHDSSQGSVAHVDKMFDERKKNLFNQVVEAEAVTMAASERFAWARGFELARRLRKEHDVSLWDQDINKLFFFADRLINAHGVDGARGVKKTSSKKALHLIA